jgi:hypothetical protein
VRGPLSAELLRLESTNPNFPEARELGVSRAIPLAMDPHFIITHPMMREEMAKVRKTRHGR